MACDPVARPQNPPRLDAPFLAARETQAVLSMLAAAGFEGRAVGGCVRNALLGVPVTDVDIASTAPPETVMRLAIKAGLRAVPTGIGHGTITVLVDHHPFEVTTLRKDVETFGRHATVAFTDDWEADAARRDFTINALYAAADGTIHDPLGGYPDLAARRVRFIGDPHARIREDYLRILRFFRFFAQYAEGAPDGAGLRACIEERGGLVTLSAERVHGEIGKLLAARRALDGISALLDTGLLCGILGVAPNPALFARLMRMEAAAGTPPSAPLRLAALAVAVDEDAPRLAARLKLSNAERDVLAASIWRTVLPLASLDPLTARRHIYARGPDRFRRALVLAVAAGGEAAMAETARWRPLLDAATHWPVPRLPVTGKDLVARGLPPGPRIGEILSALEAWWIEAGFPDDPATVAGALDQILAGQ